MTNVAIEFNKLYGLNLSPSSFNKVDFGDSANELSGKSRKNITQFLISFFTNPSSVIALLVFAGLFITSFVAPILSKYSGTFSVSTVPGETTSVTFLPPSGQWKTIAAGNDFLDELKIYNFVEGKDYFFLTDSIQGYSNRFITYDVWKIALLRNPGLSAESIIGTDSIGRDIWTRTWSGTWESLKIALLVSVISVFFGSIFGAWFGFYFGSALDIAFLKILEAYSSIPSNLWVFLLITLFPKNFWGLFGYFMISAWITPFLIARFQMQRFLRLEYFKAAKTVGVSRLGQAIRHGIPNFLFLLFNSFSSMIYNVIIGEAYLGIIGIDFDPTSPSLGKVLEDMRKTLGTDSQSIGYALLPVMIIAGIGLSTQFISFGVNDALDPKLR